MGLSPIRILRRRAGKDPHQCPATGRGLRSRGPGGQGGQGACSSLERGSQGAEGPRESSKKLRQFGQGKRLWHHIRNQLKQVALYTMHSVQETIDNRQGCFEWFGLDFMIDNDFNAWMLECNISPDLSRGTEVLEELVPDAMYDLWDMLFESQKDAAKEERSWDLVYHGKEIKKEVLNKRFWLKKNLLSELRAGRPFSMREALQAKLGPWTPSVMGASLDRGKGGRGKGRRKVQAPKFTRPSARKRQVEESESESEEDDSDSEDEE
mmetsp:Transcript_28223/g.44023  ORF Transcript_28223/g.44023 Transcript_28223/m.44023 type:complete len:266 (+) Transcript_28223:1631-2428(+)